MKEKLMKNLNTKWINNYTSNKWGNTMDLDEEFWEDWEDEEEEW